MDIANIPDDSEISALVDRISSDKLAQQKRAEMSRESFSMWLQDVVTSIALQLGYTLQQIVEFFKTMGFAVRSGFDKGREMASRKGELARKRIERKYR